MDSGASASIIHESYISKKISANNWFTMAGSFSTSNEAEITFQLSELNVTAHISTSFK